MSASSIRFPRLVQLRSSKGERRIALVDAAGKRLRLLGRHRSAHAAAMSAIAAGVRLGALLESLPTVATLSYEAVYMGVSNWRLLPAYDHPESPARCLVAGTGLTHLGSAKIRQSLHEAAAAKAGGEEAAEKTEKTEKTAPVTDSMRMFQWGVEGGKPEAGEIGVQPEWFYKGDGSILRAHGESLTVPAFGDDGGEEPEVAGAYVIAPDGTPFRLGFCTGNEFSDHVMEKKNYLYLAPSKLRQCAIGPELCVGGSFEGLRGEVRVERRGTTLWSADVATGEANMSHSLENLEHHHFKYPAHRQPGQAHVHFYGADAFSFGAGVSLLSGDVMVVRWDGLGRPLRNALAVEPEAAELAAVRSL